MIFTDKKTKTHRSEFLLVSLIIYFILITTSSFFIVEIVNGSENREFNF